MRVVSFCHWLQGPAALQYLADLGADVVRIEPPEGGFERRWSGAGTRVAGVSTMYLAANRNVRSIAINLKNPRGVDVAWKLIARAHVVAENFRPGVLDRIGLGYEAVRARHPAIIYARALQDRTFAEVEAAFESQGIWYQRVRDFDDVIADPQATYADVFRRVPVRDAQATLVNHPVRYDGATPALRHLSIDPGEDTREVLRESGYGEAELEDLLAARAVVAADNPTKESSA